MGWEKRARDVEIHVVPGSHLSLLAQPHVAVLARKLDGVIRGLIRAS
jgi:thioesterase domain-containing protein